jgi:type II secretory pathway pseudopilin PulG
MQPRTRSGFTVFELLLVLAVLGVMLGLLLPLVQQMRLMAARTQSQNNMKQIGLAVHNYANTFNNKLPPNFDANRFSAHAVLLPYLEQQALYQQINFQADIAAQANQQARKTQIPVFQSPLDPLSGTGKYTYGTTNYLFCAGSGYSVIDNIGLFCRNTKFTLFNIPDGTSLTVMTGETLLGDGGTKAVTVQRQHVRLDKDALAKLNQGSGVKDFKASQDIAADRGASWMDGSFLQSTFTGTRPINDQRPDVDCAGLGGLSSLRGTMLRGVHVGMGDGSVRFVSQNVSMVTWQNACDGNDGNPLGDDW